MEEGLKQKREQLREELDEVERMYKNLDKRRWQLYRDLLELEYRILGVWK